MSRRRIGRHVVVGGGIVVSCCWAIDVGRRQAGQHVPSWASNWYIRKPPVTIAAEAGELVLPHTYFGCRKYTAEGEHVDEVAKPLFRWPEVNTRCAAVHEMLIAFTKRMREGNEAEAAEGVEVRKVWQLFGKHVHRRLICLR